MLIRTIVFAAALATIPAAARAQEPVGCDKFRWPVGQETAALRKPDLATLPSGTEAGAPPFAAKIALRAPADAHLPMPPERAPKDGTFAGFLSLKGAQAGIYSISLSAPAWLDVIQDRTFRKAQSFSGVQGCDGIHKVVKFDLTTGPFLLQISGAATTSIAIAVMPSAVD